MEIYDIALGDDGDLLIAGGDLLIAESTHQHQRLLLLTNKGEWKQKPLAGVGTLHYVERQDDGNLAREIQTQFCQDGMQVDKITIDFPDLNIEARYED